MLQFTKMQATGNDFIVVDATKKPLRLSAGKIRCLADRHYGIGFDQLLMVKNVKKCDSDRADFGYRIFNADGSEAEMCGNGARCFALFVLNHGLTDKKTITVKAKHGLITLENLGGNAVRVNMGKPRFSPVDIPFLPQGFERKKQGNATLFKLKKNDEDLWFGVANMGNPHAIFLVEKTSCAPLGIIAKTLKQTQAFPEDVNVSVLEVQTKESAILRVCERGVGETLACGSGACAAFSLAHQMGKLGQKATIQMTGGRVTVEIDSAGDVFLTGYAVEVFTGCTAI